MSRKKSENLTELPADARKSHIGARFRALREALGLTQLQMAAMLSLPTASISNIERAVQHLRDENLERLATAKRVNPLWLLTGRGEMFLREEAEALKAGKADLLADLAAAIAAGQVHMAEDCEGGMTPILCTSDEVAEYRAGHPGAQVREKGDFVAVPILGGAVAAGPPSNVLESEVEGFAWCYRPHVKHPKHTHALRVRGESMEPLIGDGSLVGVDNAVRDLDAILRTPYRLALVRADGDEGVIVRQARRMTRELVVFEPLNMRPEFPIVTWTRGESPIVGRVIWIYRAC